MSINPTPMSPFAHEIYSHKYAGPGEEWPDTAKRVVTSVMGPLLPELVDEVTDAITTRKFMPGGRYLYAAGKPYHQVNNCLLLQVGDSREEWASLMQRVTSGLMTGAGVGVVYSQLRENGALVKGMGGTSSGPLALMEMVNEAGRHIMQGGSRRAAMWAGLHWNHPDVFDFIAMKNWPAEVAALKEKDFNFPARMDGTNISVILDDAFFAAYDHQDNPMHEWSQKVYWRVVEQMLTTAEPGFSVDVGENAGEHNRNACCELTSRDDNDICNLGSLNLAQIGSKEEFARLVEVSTAFLMCGTVYSKVPFPAVAETRDKNRRLGLGVMGVYEWLVMRGKPYAPDAELGQWMEEYTRSTDYAKHYAGVLGVSIPVKTRAIAPTGTIAILAETTTGIEPLFAKASKRRFIKGRTWHYQYIIDATAQRLIEKGVDPSSMQTAHDMADNPEARIYFQAWMQQFVDHGISSTLNLPSPDKQKFTYQQFGTMLYKYLPLLRGITAYPDGARGGQPLTVVPYEEAAGYTGYTYEEFGNEQACVSGSCGV